jgi:hypothetical protein
MSRPSSFAASQTSLSFIPRANPASISPQAAVTCPVAVAGRTDGRERKWSKHPPAEPEAFRLLAPQRGLIATAQKQISRPKLSFSRKRTEGSANRSLISLESDRREPQIPGTVKLLLPPRQSRGVSHRTRPGFGFPRCGGEFESIGTYLLPHLLRKWG